MNGETKWYEVLNLDLLNSDNFSFISDSSYWFWVGSDVFSSILEKL